MKKWFLYWYIDNEDTIDWLYIIVFFILAIVTCIFQTLQLLVAGTVIAFLVIFIDFYIHTKYKKDNRKIR